MSIVHKPAAALGKNPPATKTHAASAAPAVPEPRAVRRGKCATFGLDALCEGLTGGESLTAMARVIGVNVSTLMEWIEDDPHRSARVKEARRMSARMWDERAQEVLERAPDPFELSRAKELAHHFRWRSKLYAPREYGERMQQEITGAGGGPLQVTAADLRGLSDDELATMERLLSKAAGATGGRGER